MKVNIQLKHIIIPSIVIFITIFGLVFALGKEMKTDETLDILHLYEKKELDEESLEVQTWKAIESVVLNYEPTEESKYKKINPQNINLEKLNFSKVEQFVESSELVLLSGIEDEEFIKNLVIEFPETNFVAIGSDLEVSGPNFKEVTIDYDYINKQAANMLSNNTKTKKIAYVETIAPSEGEREFQIFVENIPEGIEVEYIYLADYENKQEIESGFSELLKEGYDSFFIGDSILNEVAIPYLAEEQKKINDQKLKDANVDEESIEEKEQKVENISVVSMIYDTYMLGIYEDVDGNATYDDPSIVLESFIINIYDFLVDIINEALIEVFDNTQLNIEIRNNGINLIEKEKNE